MSLSSLRLIFKSSKYKLLLGVLFLLFLIIYIFAWNLILLSNLYIRRDLWTALNIFFLLTISFLSSLVLVINIYNLKFNLAIHKKAYGFLAIVPSLFTSACPTCAPLILSFTSTTFGLGMSLAPYGVLIKSGIIFLLLGILYYNLANINKCSMAKNNL